MRTGSNLIQKSGRLRKISCIPSLLLAVLLTLPARAADLPDGADNRLLEFEEYFNATILPHIPGAALAVVADGQVELIRPYGDKKSRLYMQQGWFSRGQVAFPTRHPGSMS